MHLHFPLLNPVLKYLYSFNTVLELNSESYFYLIGHILLCPHTIHSRQDIMYQVTNSLLPSTLFFLLLSCCFFCLYYTCTISSSCLFHMKGKIVTAYWRFTCRNYWMQNIAYQETSLQGTFCLMKSAGLWWEVCPILVYRVYYVNSAHHTVQSASAHWQNKANRNKREKHIVTSLLL